MTIRELAISSLVLCSCVATSLDAQDFRNLPPLAASPTVLIAAASATPHAADTDAVILFESFSYRFETDGRYEEVIHRVVQILTPDGVEDWKSVSAWWAPWQEGRPSIRARVISTDKSAHSLNARDIAETAASQDNDVFSDRRILRAPLPAVTVGSIVETEVVTRRENNMFGAGVVSEIALGASDPVAATRISFDYPKALPFRFRTQLAPKLRTATSENAGRVKTVLEHSEMDPLESSPPYLPADVARRPSVSFSTGTSWQDTVTRYAPLVERQVAASDLSVLVKETLNGATARDRVIALLVAKLHKEVRYTGVEFGEAAWLPAPPTETLKRQFGDCKDKAATFIAMLRAAGIQAFPALLLTGPSQDVNPDLPGLGQFDHMIVYVPGQRDLWIDATADRWAAGALPSGDQGRQALVLRPGTVALTRTPEGKSTDNLLRETREFTLSERGPSTIVETSTAWDEAAATLRADFEDANGKRARELLTTYIKDAYLSENLGQITSGVIAPSAQEPREGFQLRVEVEKASKGFTGASDAAVGITPSAIANRLPSWFSDEPKKDEKPRKADFLMPQAFVTEWEYLIHPPAGFVFNPNLTDEETKLGPATLTRAVRELPDGAISIRFRFDTAKRQYTAEEALALRSGILKIQKEKTTLAIFDSRGHVLLQSGKVREALTEFTALAKAHPTEAIHHIQLTTALLQAGAGSAARVEASEAVRLEPNLALAHYTLGYSLLNDAVGRQFKPGFDLAGAEKAYRKAKELAPDDLETRQDLALLLEHDERGVRYSSAARLKDAISEYSEIQEKLEGTAFANNMLIACFQGGEFTTLLERVANMPSNSTRVALRLGAIAVLKGPAEAISEAGRMSQDERRQALDAAGQVLIRTRHYSEGNALLSAMGTASSNAITANLMRTGILRSLRRYEGSTTPGDPVAAARRFLFFALRDDDAMANLKDLMTPELRAMTDDGAASFTNSLRGMKGPLKRQLMQVGMPYEIVPDMMDSLTEFTVQEDGEGGYIVRTSALGSKTAAYVLKTDGKFLIAGMDTALPSSWILGLIDSGKYAAAKLWLDAARERFGAPSSDDVIAGELFPRFWSQGHGAGSAADERRMRNAVWVLPGDRDQVAKSATYFTDALKSSKTPEEINLLRVALISALLTLEKWSAAEAPSRELLAALPASDRAFTLRVAVLDASGQQSAAQALALSRSKDRPGNPAAIRASAGLSMTAGDFADALTWFERIVSSPQASYLDWNSLGWAALFAGKTDAALLDRVTRSSNETRTSAAFAHTVGAIQAELGKTSDARESTLLAMSLWDIEEPNEQCWYLFGRIAEEFGLKDTALEDYRRVTRPTNVRAENGSTWQLAQRGIQRLTKP